MLIRTPWVPARRDTPLEVFVEGDALYDAMLDDIGRAERSVRLESYILTSDAVGHVFMEALSRLCRARNQRPAARGSRRFVARAQPRGH